MPDPGTSDAPFPTLDEFWRRLDRRGVEPDLRTSLRERTTREQGELTRVGREATVVAVAGRLLPGAVPARALAVFLDGRFDQQLCRGDDPAGAMPRAELLPAGFAALDAAAQARHGAAFAALDDERADALLAAAERDEVPGPPGFRSALWFGRVRDLLLLAFGSDPRGMVQMGFPGPSYRPGHVWLDLQETEAREQRKPGYLTL